MRRGVSLVVVGVLAAALSAASARADGTDTTPTATTAATTTTAAPSYAPLRSSYLSTSCVGAGGAAIAEPGGKTLVLGTLASGLGPSAYPTTSPVVAFGSSAASGSSCNTASVSLESVSLFDGFVKASSVAARHGRGSVSGLEIDGTPASVAPGGSALLGYWGQLTLGRTVGRLTAPLVVLLLKRHWSLPAGTMLFVGFSAAAQPVAHKSTTTHPSSTTSTQPAHTTPSSRSQTHTRRVHHAKKKHRKRKQPVSKPLTVTPPLGFKPSHYDFPVNGGASYIDTYGANRSDVSGGWHHGDDLFAPLGTPVVAVANGTLSLVGWNEVGGWRLWLTDGNGNSFYYAHLAGYSRWILHHPHVRAGEVVGFLGRTGDAFTTTPHLHFEVHPQELIKLGYDGAVNPTDYLHKWRVVHVPAKEMPRPAKLKAPVGTPAQEASVVWHQLLVARHLLHTTQPATSPTTAPVRRLFPHPPSVEASGVTPLRAAATSTAAARVSATTSLAVWLGAGLAGAALALSAGAFTLRRRRRTTEETPPPVVETSG